MAYRIRSKDIRLARSSKGADKSLHRFWKPSALKEYAEASAKAMGYKIVPKPSSFLRLSKFTTTYYRQIRVGSGYRSMNEAQQASVLMHELRHGYQWRYWGMVVFGARYLMWPRWRWAVEMQGYSEGIWAMVAMRFRRGEIEQHIDHVVTTMRKSYSLRSINKRDFERRTREVLESAYNDARNGIS